jgi:hypothetical protein
MKGGGATIKDQKGGDSRRGQKPIEVRMRVPAI